MSRAPSTFRQRDMAAAVKAVKAAGCVVSRVMVDREGRIVVETAQAQDAPANEWDRDLGTASLAIRPRI